MAQPNMSHSTEPQEAVEMLNMATTDDPSTSAETTNTALSTSTRAPTPFRGKSTFMPPKYRNSSLETYCRLVEKDVSMIFNKRKQYKLSDNMTQEQRDELKSLKEDKTLVIQSADKGGAIVVLNRDAYEGEILQQLANVKFYKKLERNPISETKTRIHEGLNILLEQGMITKSEHTFMKVDFPITPVFYTLPKIHKQFTDVPPGRPIVSAIGSLTENMSAFVDYFLQPLVTNLPSYTRDSMEFIKMIKSIQKIEEAHILVTMDIESLYTNVPFEGGLQAAKMFLDQRSDCNPTTDCLLGLTMEVLKSNFFLFGNSFYLQTSGVAMGSRMSPSFASLYVGHFEQDVIFNNKVNPYIGYISNWKRYLDDIFFIWSGSENSLNEFHQFMNSQNRHLKFTMAANSKEMNFLDILIVKEDKKLKTNLYRKPTDRNSLLHGDSYHPLSLKRNLPISQFNRIRRICSSDEDYNIQAREMSDRFQKRGYKEEWIKTATSRFSGITQTECLSNKRPKQTEHRVCCAIEYSPVSKDIEKTINKYWYIIDTDPFLKKCLPNPPRVVHKRAPNLRNMLVRADLPPPAPSHFLSDIPPGNYPCGRCQQCNFTRKSNSFNHPHTGKKYKIRGIITCSTANVVYMLKCPCGLSYIGKTSRALKTRIAEHRSTIRNNVITSPVAVHFNKAGHNVSTLRYTGIELVQSPRRGGDVNNMLLKRELFWIHTLQTLAPKGLNEDYDIRPFL